uniref:C-type lectin domain-containing protein n=1 Tax=Fundulus heteroclitus TaxID=8078 RepID=A0A3Q2QW40_FUNHE
LRADFLFRTSPLPGGVAAPTGGGGSHLGDIRQSRRGSLCLQRHGPLCPLVLPVRQFLSSGMRCAGPRLAQNSPVCLPPVGPDSSDPPAGPPGRAHYCREMYADLATVDSSEESDRLFLALQQSGQFAWIGLYDNTTGWKWTMGDDDFVSNNDFPPWERNQPDNANGKQSCMVMNWVGDWEHLCLILSFDCKDKSGLKPFILLLMIYMIWLNKSGNVETF